MKSLASFAIITALALPAAAHAQTLSGAAKWADSARREIEAGSFAGDTVRIAAAETLVERALTAFPDDALLLHYQGYGLYRLATLIGGMKNAPPPTEIFARAEKILEQSEKIQPMAETSAILALVEGRLIAADPSKAMILGMKIGSEMGEATGLGPKNPRVWLIRGINAMFTPAQWGGGDDIAEKNLLRAIDLFATDKPKAPLPSWGKSEAYAWLGQIYQKQKKTADARTAYTNALTAEPGNNWVKYVLLPSLSAAQQ